MSLTPYFGYLTVDTFDSPPFLMFTNNDCPICAAIQQKAFEPTSMRLWCALAKTATGVFDIGAHVGVYSLAAAAIRNDLPINAFEPNPHAFARLRVNKSRNGFSNIVEHRLALGHEDNKLVKITWREKPGHPISSGSGIGSKAFSGQTESDVTPMCRLDALDVPKLGGRGAVKIDVEGAEQVVFAGMKQTLRERPDIILESFHQEACDEITSLTKPLGYRYFSIDEAGGNLAEQGGLIARDRSTGNFNQFLTVRDPPI